jgi:hypothetical protein
MSLYLTAQTALPPRTQFVAKEAGDLACLRLVSEPHSCGTAPDSHRTSLTFLASGLLSERSGVYGFVGPGMGLPNLSIDSRTDFR